MAILEFGLENHNAGISRNVVVISELPVIGKADGQFLENLVYLRSTVVVDSAALPRESHNQELCPVHDDRSSKPEIIPLVRRPRRLRTVVR